MKPEPDVELGVECAWVPAPEEPKASRLWLGATVILLAVGAWQVGYGAWTYVALAFFS